MYCSKCGEADQTVNSYCRKCGSFRLDSLKKQINIILVADLVVMLCSFLMILLWIWTKIIEATRGRSIFDLTWEYNFFFGILIFNLVTHFMFFVSVLRKMSKPSDGIELASEEMNAGPKNLETKDLLPPADLQNVVPSVVEETTKNLSKVGRK